MSAERERSKRRQSPERGQGANAAPIQRVTTLAGQMKKDLDTKKKRSLLVGGLLLLLGLVLYGVSTYELHGRERGQTLYTVYQVTNMVGQILILFGGVFFTDFMIFALF